VEKAEARAERPALNPRRSQSYVVPKNRLLLPGVALMA
jgi:hypothetical protein